MDRYKRVSKRWRDALSKTKEYEVVESEYVYDAEVSPVDSYVAVDEYQHALQVKKELLKRYAGKKLVEVIPGKEIENDAGNCYYIVHEQELTLNTIDASCARQMIISELKLLRGVGRVSEERLKGEGYLTIEDLKDHPRFGAEARRCLEIIDQGDMPQLIGWLVHWLPKSHPLVLFASGLHRVEDFLVVDIESMGIFTRPIILFGVAQLSNNKINVHQYFVRNIMEEPAALVGFLSHVNERTAFVTFNGRTFDIPYIKERLAYYGIDGDLERPHFDALHFSRRLFGEYVPNCRLATLEKFLFSTVREKDIPSALVPEFYEKYLLSKNCGPLVPVIEHNRQDLLSLANIFSKLHEVCQRL